MLGWLLSAHLIGVIMWTGTLLVLTRTLRWTATQPHPGRSSLVALQKRLLFSGALPGLVLTLGAGSWMLFELDFGPLRAADVGAGFHIKLALVALLIGLHFAVQGKLQALEYPETPSGLRWLHPAVALLVTATIIVVLVVYPALARKKAAERVDQAAMGQLEAPQ